VSDQLAELLTPRLRLRRWRAEDEAPMVTINSDPEVTEFLNRDMDAAATDRPELGWRLGRESWGHGYATEAALAARDDAFGRLGLPALISIIHPENEPSRRVATKVGMSIRFQVFNPVHDLEVDIWGGDAPTAG
jgi:RimJ/RimL family protein N-acetyltransferase